MKKLLAALAVTTAALVGCPHHHVKHPVPHLIGVKVAVPVGCAHHAGCGHYYHGGAWYHASGHYHGHGCGHFFRGGVWVVD